jgi:hypothetical protein
MDGNWFSHVPIDGTWLAFLTAIGALGALGTIVALLRQRTPRMRIDVARVARRRSPAH